MKKRNWSIVAILLVLTLILSACVGTKKSEQVKGGEESGGGTKEETKTLTFPEKTDNKDKAIKGGTVNVGLITDSPFQGIFSEAFQEDNYDAEISNFMTHNIFATDGDFLVKDGGIASLKVDFDAKKATVTIQGDVKWSDGQPLTVEDLMLPYEIIGHKDYEGVRYDEEAQNVVGMTEYHDGKADKISGLKKVDDKTLEISFKKLSPAVYTGTGDGILYYAEPTHYFKGIAVKDLLKSDQIRKKPLSLGAFKIDKIVNGESVEMSANEYYFKGKPKLDKVVLKVVPTTSSVAALKAGEIDVAISMPTDIYPTYKDLDNLTLLGRPELSYSYIGFNLGTYDKEKTVAVMDPNAKTADVKLREAIAYGTNVEELNAQFYDGLRTRANSIIPPVFKSYYASSLEGFKYDPEKAKKILDDAGYKDTNNDGIREDKNGKPFELKFAFMAGGDNAEAMASYYLQNWKDIGLNVTLTTGRPIEFNSFYDKVQANAKDIDLYQAAWATGTNPSPNGVYNKSAVFNMSRFTSPEMDKLLQEIDSDKAAQDPAFRADAFMAWEKYMAEQIPVFPTQFRTEIIPVNKRLKNVDYSHEDGGNYEQWELTEDKAPKAGN